MKEIRISYIFSMPSGPSQVFNLRLEAERLQLRVETDSNGAPEWTALGFHQCSNCPLSVETHPQCPAALGLADLVTRSEGLVSYDEVEVQVRTDERIISQKTTAQKGISALMGLIMATSGCPHASFFKPMARFHLPLASEEETIYRVTSMYLLAQFFRKLDGRDANLELDGLTRIYEEMQEVNTSMASRLRAATETDSSVNAIVLLDIYAKTLPIVIEESLEEIRYLFSSYFEEPS
jgi:hypothetical protein